MYERSIEGLKWVSFHYGGFFFLTWCVDITLPILGQRLKWQRLQRFVQWWSCWSKLRGRIVWWAFRNLKVETIDIIMPIEVKYL